MKTFVCIIFTFCSFFQIHAQGLIITYQETKKTEPQSRSRDMSQYTMEQRREIERQNEELNRALSEEQSRSSQMTIHKNHSYYKAGIFSSQTQFPARQAVGNIAFIATPSKRMLESAAANPMPYAFYKNHHQNLMLSQCSYKGREYIVEDQIPEYSWKIGRRKKKVSDFECYEATSISKNGERITAWFTHDIPIGDGPANYCGLPGLILYLETKIGDTKFTYSCTHIDQEENIPDIEVPEQGERMTRAEFDRRAPERIALIER